MDRADAASVQFEAMERRAKQATYVCEQMRKELEQTRRSLQVEMSLWNNCDLHMFGPLNESDGHGPGQSNRDSGAAGCAQEPARGRGSCPAAPVQQRHSSSHA